MNKVVWLVNLFGNPCAPSAFNPDNSLAALAGNLKAAGYQPLIVDLQTVSVCERLFPSDWGKRAQEHVAKAQTGTLSDQDLQLINAFDEQVTAHQKSVVDELAREIVARYPRPAWVGLKIYSGEGSTLSRHLAKRLKEILEVPMLAGGPLIRVIDRKYMELYSEFDFLIDGEADRAIVSFARFVEGSESRLAVPGLIWREPGGEIRANPADVIRNLSELADPCYDRDVYPALWESGEKALVFQIDESRGCPNKCNFCVHPNVNGRVVRVMPVERIINQVKQLQSQFGAVAFRLTGSNTPKKFLREFAAAILREGLQIRYSCFSSINTTDVSVVAPLKESGLVGVFIGVETTDQNILKNVFSKHGQTKEKISQILKAFLDAGIYTTTSWIYPMPGATKEIRDEVRDFIIEAYADRGQDAGSVLLLPAVLIPRSEWFRTPERFGFRILNEDQFYRDYAELSMRFFLPRQLMNSFSFSMEGKDFLECAAETDSLERELVHRDISLGLSDEWMLMGKLSGYSMKEFREVVSNALVQGDWPVVRDLMERINSNSASRSWAA